jgi:hypothetical protein
MANSDPGVPEALPRALRHLAEHLGPRSLDRLWIFPPLRKGRRESGLIAAGCFNREAGQDGEGEEAGKERRRLVTLAYRAEETGKGVTFEPIVQEEGEAPDDRLPRVIEGVVQRSGEEHGEPRPVPLGGDPQALEALLEELEPRTLDPGSIPGIAEEAST